MSEHPIYDELAEQLPLPPFGEPASPTPTFEIPAVEVVIDGAEEVLAALEAQGGVEAAVLLDEDLPTYTVTVARDNDCWVATVANLPGGATDVTDLNDLADSVTDLIATLTDTPPGRFRVYYIADNYFEQFFAEPDEPVAEVQAAFAQGEPVVTAPPEDEDGAA